MAAELTQSFIEPLKIGDELGLHHLQLLQLLSMLLPLPLGSRPIAEVPFIFQEKTGAVKLTLLAVDLRLQVIGQSLMVGSSDVLANRELPFVYSFYGH
ncbi:MAG: hypothetical protein Q8P66_00395 [Candidatus Colwellbacteria bacterium]|nr:hypothetical protein [Candidatus Colwellbacteria bacterium]